MRRNNLQIVLLLLLALLCLRVLPATANRTASGNSKASSSRHRRHRIRPGANVQKASSKPTSSTRKTGSLVNSYRKVHRKLLPTGQQQPHSNNKPSTSNNIAPSPSSSASASLSELKTLFQAEINSLPPPPPRSAREYMRPSWLKLKDFNHDEVLNDQVLNSRRLLHMRDNDIVLVGFQMSGVEWLAQLVSELVPELGKFLSENPKVASTLDEVSLAPGLPVFSLLLAANTLRAPVRPAYALDRIPKTIPRVFVSFMPISHFEYRVTPNTRLLYMLRQPQAIWHSVLEQLQFEERRIRDAVASYAVDGAAETSLDLEEFTEKFVGGDVYVPPRMSEKGPAFALARHIGGWLGSDKLFYESVAHAVDIYFASELAGVKSQLLNRNKMNMAVVDFQNTLVDPAGTIERVAEFLNVSVPLELDLSYERSRVLLSNDDIAAPSIGNTTNAGFADLYWQETFSSLPLKVQASFNATLHRGYLSVQNTACAGRECAFKVINIGAAISL